LVCTILFFNEHKKNASVEAPQEIDPVSAGLIYLLKPSGERGLCLLSSTQRSLPKKKTSVNKQIVKKKLFYLLTNNEAFCYFSFSSILYSHSPEPMNNQTLSINNLPDLLTVREVAQILRVSPLTIKRWGKRGKLPAIRINSRGDRRYKKEAVLYLLGLQQRGDMV
jgi:excisionase family DNA binding protein